MPNMFSCHRIEHYKNATPSLNLIEFFTGKVKAWGIIQDWRGRVTNKFDIEMFGTWENDTCTLHERYAFYDGKIQDRIWKIQKISDGHYNGFAHDILGAAEVLTQGNAAHSRYKMDLPVHDKVYRLSFDDWMWQMNDGVVINRSYIKKFGITVSEMTIFLQKQ